MIYLLVLAALWLTLVAVRFRTSKAVLIGGLVVLTAAALGLMAHCDLEPRMLGIAAPGSWIGTLAMSVGWAGLMLLYTPLADRIATYFFVKPPTLEAFRAIQESRARLIGGILIAWILGGLLEELVLRGIMLGGTEQLLKAPIGAHAAVAIGITLAAVGAFVIHLYQGLRAAFIIAQLSILFGVLFVIGGGTLATVILCHGMYDTVAFIRFANRASKYSNLDLPPGDRATSADASG